MTFDPSMPRLAVGHLSFFLFRHHRHRHAFTSSLLRRFLFYTSKLRCPQWECLAAVMPGLRGHLPGSHGSHAEPLPLTRQCLPSAPALPERSWTVTEPRLDDVLGTEGVPLFADCGL